MEGRIVASGRSVHPLGVVASPRSAVPTMAHVLMFLGWGWCLAVCVGLPVRTVTTALAVAYGLLFAVLLPFNRWACFLVIVAGCATERALQAWTPIRFNTLHYATLLLLPVAYALTRPRAQLPKPLIFWVGLCLWFAVSVLWSRDLSAWREQLVEYCGVAALALLTRQLANSPQRRRELGAVFAITCIAVLVALLALSDNPGGRLGQEIADRSAGGLNANQVGVTAAMGILMLAISSAERGRHRVLTPVNLGMYLVLGAGLLLTQSRGSILAATGAALTIALAQPRLHHRLIGVGALLGLSAALVLVALKLNPTGMETRWNETFASASVAERTAGRSEIARTAVQIMHHHWFSGIGGGQFGQSFKEYSVLVHSTYGRGKQKSAHSGYLTIVTENGVVGALLLTGFYLSLWFGAVMLPAGQRRAVACGVVVFMVIIPFSTLGIDKADWLAIGLLLAWYAGNRKQGPSNSPHLERHAATPQRSPVEREVHR
jgi:O-antigen ligase